MNEEILRLILQVAPIVFKCIRDMDPQRANRIQNALDSDHGKMFLSDVKSALSDGSSDLMG